MDDSNPKTEAIKKFLIESCAVPEENIDVSKSINAGRRKLYTHDYDILLLDLVMPAVDDGEKDQKESPKFIDEIYTNVNIHIPVHIIGFSEYEDLLDASMERFEDKLWHLIKFKINQNDWKTKLMNKVQHLMRTKQMFQSAVENKHRFDVGVICALDHEFSAMKESFIDLTWKKYSIEKLPFTFYVTEMETLNGNLLRIIACCVNKMGMQATAVVSSYMYSTFKIDKLFMTGICAGIEGKVNIGDIIVADSIFDYGSGKMESDDNKEAKFTPSYQQIPVDYGLSSKVHDFLDESEFHTDLIKFLRNRVHYYKAQLQYEVVCAPTACGSYVIANKTFADTLKVGERKLAGVEMEGYGLYTAGHIAERKFMMIKAVCDLANEQKGDDYQEMCEYESGFFLYSFLRESF